MDKKLLQKYAQVKAEMAALELKKKALEDQVIEEIESNADDHRSYRSAYGLFEISGRRSWKYSPAVDIMKEALAIAKKKEEKTGAAELMRESTFVVFTPSKE